MTFKIVTGLSSIDSIQTSTGSTSGSGLGWSTTTPTMLGCSLFDPYRTVENPPAFPTSTSAVTALHGRSQNTANFASKNVLSIEILIHRRGWDDSGNGPIGPCIGWSFRYSQATFGSGGPKLFTVGLLTTPPPIAIPFGALTCGGVGSWDSG